MATIAFNHASDNIYALGTNDGGNIVNMPVNTLDLILKLDIRNRIEIAASIKNMLDPKIERVQENFNEHVTVMSYKNGIISSVKLSFLF